MMVKKQKTLKTKKKTWMNKKLKKMLQIKIRSWKSRQQQEKKIIMIMIKILKIKKNK